MASVPARPPATGEFTGMVVALHAVMVVCKGRSIKMRSYENMSGHERREGTMTTVGTGKYTYQLTENWAKLPAGETFGNTSAVATDSQDHVYVFQRKDPPVLVFERDGTYLRCWGISAI